MELSFPIMITLQEIRDHSPCKSGWVKVLAANGGASADMNKPFEIASIIDSNDFYDCLWALQCKPAYQHVHRRFAVICADEVAHLFCDDRSYAALDVAWRYSYGEASDDELAAARGAASAAAWDAAWDAARDAAWVAARDAAWDAARGAARDAARDAAVEAAWGAAWGACLALVAWDEAGELMDKPVSLLRFLAQEEVPAAVLLLPAAIAMEVENEPAFSGDAPWEVRT
jgi:hypothetical protein